MSIDSEIRNSNGELLDYTFHDGVRDDFLVVLGHGVTGNKDRPLIKNLAVRLAEAGWPALRVSFSGNGESEGSFEEATISKEVGDLSSVLSAVGSGKKFIYVGHSMGGAVGVLGAGGGLNFAALVSLAGMVFTKQFADAEFGDEVPGEGYMWGDKDCPLSQGWVDDLNSIENVLASAKNVSCPWLLVHGTEDDVVPLKDSKSAYDSCDGMAKMEIVEGGDHVFSEHLVEVSDLVVSWLDEVFLNGSLASQA